MNAMTANEVHMCVDLYHQGWGVINISRQMDVPEKTIEAVLLGKRHAKITGGRIMLGKRPKEQLAIYKIAVNS
jgi:hypothetical protein